MKKNDFFTDKRTRTLIFIVCNTFETVENQVFYILDLEKRSPLTLTRCFMHYLVGCEWLGTKTVCDVGLKATHRITNSRVMMFLRKADIFVFVFVGSFKLVSVGGTPSLAMLFTCFNGVCRLNKSTF